MGTTASQRQSIQRKRERLSSKLKKRRQIYSQELIDSLTGDDKIIIEAFRNGTKLEDIAILIGRGDRRWIGARKSEIMKQWRSKKGQ